MRRSVNKNHGQYETGQLPYESLGVARVHGNKILVQYWKETDTVSGWNGSDGCPATDEEVKLAQVKIQKGIKG